MENWKDLYIQNLGSENISNTNIDIAQNIKLEKLPNKLYKYRAVSDYSLDNLNTDTVWVNKPSDYNDPYEFYEKIDFNKIYTALTKKHIDQLLDRFTKKIPVPDKILNEAKKKDNPLKFLCEHLLKENDFSDSQVNNYFAALEEVIEKHGKEIIANRINDIQDKMKVCSFCESPEVLLMWSHYADSHKGICIEYNIQKWRESDIRRRILFPVIYKNSLYNSTNHLLRFINEENFNNLYPIISGSTKSNEWNYEKEWRFIFQNGDSFPAQNYPMNCQCKVYLGYKIEDESKKKIIKICENKNIDVYQSKLKSDSYSLEFEKIN